MLQLRCCLTDWRRRPASNLQATRSIVGDDLAVRHAPDSGQHEVNLKWGFDSYKCCHNAKHFMAPAPFQASFSALDT